MPKTYSIQKYIHVFFFQVHLEAPRKLTDRQRREMLNFALDDDYDGSVHGAIRTGQFAKRIE